MRPGDSWIALGPELDFRRRSNVRSETVRSSAACRGVRTKSNCGSLIARAIDGFTAGCGVYAKTMMQLMAPVKGAAIRPSEAGCGSERFSAAPLAAALAAPFVPLRVYHV
jgi:hypothetical protein